MSVLTTITRKVCTLARYIGDPRLFILRQRGGLVDEFQTLNQAWFHTFHIATVLDIGANTGQFATTINMVFPKAIIYSFEPLPDCFTQMQQRMGKSRRFVGLNIGLGDKDGEIVFQRNEYTPSSSFLKMASAHKQAFPYTQNKKDVSVKVKRLDDVAKSLTITDPLLIKIDVQGYEDYVLRGGEQTIKRAQLIIIETSFEILYEEQPLFHDIYEKLISWGFTYMGSLHQLSDPNNGHILQQNSLFCKV